VYHAGGAVKLECLKLYIGLLSMFRVFATFYTLVECTSDLSKYEKAFGLKVHHTELAVKVTNFVVKFLVLVKIILYLMMSVVGCKLFNFSCAAEPLKIFSQLSCSQGWQSRWTSRR
jgi:hypothetical protein